MEIINLNEPVNIKKISESNTEGVFEIEGLYRGYGLTIGNALRRVLLSSLPGAAITQVKIKGTSHEFSTIDGVIEDVVEICLNLKKIRFRFSGDKPQILELKVKGEKKVTAADIKYNPEAEVITPDIYIATLTAKSAVLEMELTVEKGLGYEVIEERKSEKLSIGTIVLDALFSPVANVNFSVENMRVGDRTDYNRVRFEIKTDGSITPSSALRKAGDILKDHFDKISKIEVLESAVFEKTKGVAAPKSEKKKKTKKTK